MNTVIDLTMYAFIVVFIVDLSGFTDTWLNFLSGWTGKRIVELKPFSCSLCMVFWLGLLRCWLTVGLNLYTVTLVCLLSFLSGPMGQILLLMREAINKIINSIGRHV